jgi:predicted nucleic acid-binding protein
LERFLADTNIIEGVTFNPFRLPKPLCFSSVVFSELMTACNDSKELRQYQKAWKDALAEAILIVPTEADWLSASRIQFFLAQERKQNAGGKAPKRTAKVKQELAMDCLIAASCCRENITVVTNDNDYVAIRRYLKNLKIMNLE